MLVDPRVVAVRMTVLADHGRVVMMVVVAVVVSMSVLVLQGLVGVTVPVAQVQVDAKAKQQRRGAPLVEAYGTSTRWEEHFRATGNGLGGGSGWTVLELELQTGEIRTTWSGNHTQTLATAYPLLVLDMYEHAYQMDFGAAAAKYIDAFFANIHWDEVNRRLERGVAAAKLLHG